MLRENQTKCRLDSKDCITRKYCASQIIIRTGIIEVSRCSQKYDIKNKQDSWRESQGDDLKRSKIQEESHYCEGLKS